MLLSHRPVRRTAARIASLGVVAALLVGAAPAPAWGDSIRDQQWHLSLLNVAEAHRYIQGEGVTVAIVGGGVDATHPDLTGNVLTGTETFDGGTGDGKTDTDGYSTALAGLIAGHGHGPGNTAGVLGIAPKAKILPIRTSKETYSDYAAIVRGIDYAVAHGAQVICIALVGSESHDEQRAVEAALAADVVVVAGVGDNPPALIVAYPAAYPGVVAAAGVDQDGNHASVSVTGTEVVLAAPAVKVLSTDTGGGYRIGTSTNYAAAIIAGAAALVRSRYPRLSGTEVVRRLTTTALDKGVAGRDPQYGYGVANLVDALNKDVPPLPSASPSVTSTASADQPAALHNAVAAGGSLVILLIVVCTSVLMLRSELRR